MTYEERLEKAKTYLDLALKSEQRIQQSIQRVSEKTKNAFTLASALIPIVAGLGYFIGKETNSYWILFPVFLSLLAFVASIVLGIRLFRPTGFDYLDPRYIVEKYKDQNKSTIFFIYTWASTIVETTNNNASILNSKEKAQNYMYTFIIIGLATLALSFLFLAICLTSNISLPTY